MFTFSHNSLIKNNPIQLFHKIIDEIGEEPLKGLSELESYKKKAMWGE